jgi:type II secretory pathway component PulF
LDDAEAQQLVAYLAELDVAALPLPAGLRAAAAEASSRRLARQLCWLADEVEAGRSLDESLDDAQTPRRLGALVRAASRTGDFAGVIGGMLEVLQASREAQQSIRSALAYPALVLLLAILVFVFFSLAVVSPLEAFLTDEFPDFDQGVPNATLAVLWMANVGIWIVLAACAVLLLLGLTGKRLLGDVRWHRCLAGIPAIGSAWQWCGVVEMSRIAGILLDCGLPLPEALRRTADVLGNGYVAAICRQLAERVAAGVPLSQAAADDGRLPLGLVPLLRWGEAMNALPVALDDAGKLLAQRLRMRAAWLRALLPPIAFIIVASGVLTLYVGLLLPILRIGEWFY